MTDNFEIKSMNPQDILGSMIDELHLGACLMPFPEEFLEHLRKDGYDDPETSQQYFYMQLKKMDGEVELTLLTILEAMQLHEAVHKYIKNMIEAINDQLED